LAAAAAVLAVQTWKAAVDFHFFELLIYYQLVATAVAD